MASTIPTTTAADRPSSRASDRSESDSDTASTASDGYVSESDIIDSEPTLCPLCPETLPSPTAVFAHLKSSHNFNFFAEKRRLGLDFYGAVKLVNYLRREKVGKQGEVKREALEDETLLKPVVEGDPLILGLDEGEEAEEAAAGKDVAEDGKEKTAEEKLKELVEELERVKGQFEAYKDVVAEGFRKELAERVKVKEGETDWRVGKKRDDDSHYFESYSHNDIHEVMLKDTVRTDAYRDFIYGNKDLFAGKTVLDVGCGTGVLSMFCARAGAKHVYAVDNSSIIDKAREHVLANGLSDKITMVRGKIENISLPVDKVDIIVSEWMGYCLLYEAMLDSVLYARDKFLVPGGLMIPSHTSIHIVPAHSPDYVNDSYNFWHDVYGFNMSAMKRPSYESVDIRTMDAEISLTTPLSLPPAFCVLPLHTVTTADLEFTHPFTATIARSAETLDAFVISFETFFARTPDREILPTDSHWSWPSRQAGEVSFTTAMQPQAKSLDESVRNKFLSTHWQQGVLPVLPEKNGGVSEGEVVVGEVSYRKSKENSREVEVEVKWKVGEVERRQKWQMR